ncbi:MAG: hypothetical protein AAFY72_12520 [Cyanobacteria bacterium J06649_4]
MSEPKRPRLKPNPFISLRDPETGEWRVVFNFQKETFPKEKVQQEASL